MGDRMKNTLLASLMAGLVAVSLMVSGCGGGGGTKMETAEFQTAFASADATLKGQAEEAAKALNAGKLFEGATALANLAKSAEKLSDDQKTAMVNLGATIQLLMSEDGDKADLKVYQAVEDMVNALEDREPTQVGTTPDRVAPPKAPAESE